MRITVAVVISMLFAACTIVGHAVPAKYTSDVQPSAGEYDIPQDLSEIRHLQKADDLTDAGKQALRDNGFVVCPDRKEQMFYVYEQFEHAGNPMPNFITVDSVLQAYHIMFDFALRHIEHDSLVGLCKHLTNLGCKVSVGHIRKAEGAAVREAAGRNLAYFLVARNLLEGTPPTISGQLPDKSKITALARSELEKISQKAGRSQSPILGRNVHYDQFRPRGHYTRSEALSKYFQAMMWYGTVGFELDEPKDNPQLIRRHVLQALLMTKMMHDTEWARSLWDRIYEPTTFFVGTADDLTWRDYLAPAKDIFGDDLTMAALADDAKLDSFINLARRKLDRPQIAPAYLQADAAGNLANTLNPPPQGRQFRFMGQRFIPDSYMMQQLVWPKVGSEARQRYWPKGLDVMAVLGSQRARQILFDRYSQDRYKNYAHQIIELSEKFSAKSAREWQQNLYWGWLHSLRPLFDIKRDGYPTFMSNAAWLDKELMTSLGSWAQLRHDTILYGKPSGVEKGGAPPEPAKGYVEPYPEVYGRLAWLTEKMRSTLTDRGLMQDKVQKACDDFSELLLFLKTCSEKHLQDTPLTKEQYRQIQYFGGTLERLTLSVAADDEMESWYNITNKADRHIATIADVHTSFGKCLQVGVGWAYKIYVIVPHPSLGLQLAKGGVMTYHEFKQPVGDRLTDEKWIQMLEEDDAPPIPKWTESFVAR